ncbi:hypothetical protein PENTCL1PPCAC_29228, partial [Pristionchus entomophagus]
LFRRVIASTMPYFMLANIALVVTVMDSKPPGIVLLDTSAHHCNAKPIFNNAKASLRSEHACLQSVVVPDGHVAQAHVTNRDAYCDLLSNDQLSAALITSDGSDDVNFCSTEDRAITVPSGTHYIRVTNSEMPLRLSVTFLKTALACHDIVSDALIGMPLTLVPTEHKCTIVLPSRTILEIRKITRTEAVVKDSQNCARVRMGRTFYSLNLRWPRVCEIPSDDTYEYELGCSAALLDASNLAIARVEFTLHQMDDYKAMTSPLMCALEKDNMLP